MSIETLSSNEIQQVSGGMPDIITPPVVRVPLPPRCPGGPDVPPPNDIRGPSIPLKP